MIPTPEQQRRYLEDADYHAKVDVVARAIWNTTSVALFEHAKPFPYERLIDDTKTDLIVYAMAAVEALEDAGRAPTPPDTVLAGPWL